ncbi:hypothetical protein MTR67_043234, partial [Solanum verrucosum]
LHGPPGRTVGHPTVRRWRPSVAPVASEICNLVSLGYEVLHMVPASIVGVQVAPVVSFRNMKPPILGCSGPGGQSGSSGLSQQSSALRGSAPLARGRGRVQSGKGGRASNCGAIAQQSRGQVGESLVVDKVYQSYFVSLARYDTWDVCLIWTFFWDTSVKMPPMDSLPVVSEILDVFLIDLLGVLPDRDIDIVIDLEPSTKPISISPYCMALEELKELKGQLQNLLSKGFIHPSLSP